MASIFRQGLIGSSGNTFSETIIINQLLVVKYIPGKVFVAEIAMSLMQSAES